MPHKKDRHNLWIDVRSALIPALAMLTVSMIATKKGAPDKFDFLLWIALATLLVVSLLFWGYLSTSSAYHAGANDFRKWAETFRADLDALLRSPPGSATNPGDNDDVFDILDKTKARRVQFKGTMVGFSYIMPKPLSEFITNAQGDVNIDIVGSKIRINAGEAGSDFLAVYPAAMIVKILRELMPRDRYRTSSPKTTTISVNYLSRDIVSAYMAIGETSIMLVQALAPGNADFIIQNQYQGQVLTANSPHSSPERIKRYLTALESIREQEFGESSGETWIIDFPDSKNAPLSLRIEGRTFWHYDEEKVDLRSVDFNKFSNIDLRLEGRQIGDFANSFYERLDRIILDMKEKDQDLLAARRRVAKATRNATPV